MEKEIKSKVLNEIGALYVSHFNAGKQMSGSTFVLPKEKFQSLIADLGILHTDESKSIDFMSCKVYCSKNEIEEIEFVENSLDVEEKDGEERAQLLKDASSKISEEIKEILRQRKEALVNALKEAGITFADEEAFKQFAKTQIIHEERNGADAFIYEGKVLIEFPNKYNLKK